MVNFAYGADIPRTVDANMSEVVTFETRLMVAGVVAQEWGVNGYAMDSPCGINFMTKFSALKGQLDLGGERRRGSGRKGLRVGGRSQLFDISLQIIGKFRHLHLIEGGE